MNKITYICIKRKLQVQNLQKLDFLYGIAKNVKRIKRESATAYAYKKMVQLELPPFTLMKMETINMMKITT